MQRYEGGSRWLWNVFNAWDYVLKLHTNCTTPLEDELFAFWWRVHSETRCLLRRLWDILRLFLCSFMHAAKIHFLNHFPAEPLLCIFALALKRHRLEIVWMSREVRTWSKKKHLNMCTLSSGRPTNGCWKQLHTSMTPGFKSRWKIFWDWFHLEHCVDILKKDHLQWHNRHQELKGNSGLLIGWSLTLY